MRVITDQEELNTFYKSISHETDGGNFSFVAGGDLLCIECGHRDSDTVFFIEFHKLTSEEFHLTQLARPDEVGSAYLNNNFKWVETIVFEEDEEEAAFLEYTKRIIRGAKDSF